MEIPYLEEEPPIGKKRFIISIRIFFYIGFIFILSLLIKTN